MTQTLSLRGRACGSLALLVSLLLATAGRAAPSDLRQIAEEFQKAKQKLLQAVATPGQAVTGRLPGLELKATPRRSAGGFKIRY